MRRPRFVPGSIVRIKLQDGSYSYGRLLRLPNVALYDYRTGKPEADLQEIVSKPVLFTVTISKHALDEGKWEIIGKLPLEDRLSTGIENFIQDPTDPRKCEIIDSKGNIRDASVEECMGLERAALWEPEHVEERLMDHYLGRKSEIQERMKLKFPVTRH